MNLYYSRDNFTNNETIVLNRTNQPGTNNFLWSIPDPVSVFTINDTDLPVTVKVRVEDANDTTVSTDSEEFTLDYYNITWSIRDFLSNMQVVDGLLMVNDSSGWIGSDIVSPKWHLTPYGSWQATWTHKDYGDATELYIADDDKNITVWLESKVVHVWEAKTEYSYDVDNDTLTFQSYLSRDGVMAGARDDNGTFYTIANRTSIEVYYPNGTHIDTFNTSNVTEAGFFKIDWLNTSLDTSIVYSAITQIDTLVGGKFRTPFMINLIPTVSLYDITVLIEERVDMPISVMNQSIMTELVNQTVIIQEKMDEMEGIIKNETANMTDALNATLDDFESRTYTAIEDLQTAANQTVAASEVALVSAAQLEEVAIKFSWKASVSPNPALSGDNITITAQGPAEAKGVTELIPLLDIYSWDNEWIIKSAFAGEITISETVTFIAGEEIVTKSAIYYYKFAADDRFDVGKAYMYLVTEHVTGGMATGSGMVESVSLTTVAGLAAAAPEARRAAQKALDAIRAVEAVIVTQEGIHIALTLKSLKESIDAIPGTLAREGGPTEEIRSTVNEISDKLQALGIKEGFNFQDLLEEALGESPALKEVRSKTEAIRSVVELLLNIFEARFGGKDAPIVSTSLVPGSIRFRVVATNPSSTKTQEVDVKVNLPSEIKPRDVLDTGGLDLRYDVDQSIYYVYKPGVELAPNEIRVFHVEVEDVWFIHRRTLADLRRQTDSVLDRLKRTDYYQTAQETAEIIYSTLDEIDISQANEMVSREEHIGIYRDNLRKIERIEDIIAKLEKALATAGGPLAPSILAKTKIKSEEPSKSMTWIVIFSIIIFIGLLAGALFFTWLRQSRLTKDELLSSKKSAFPEDETKDKESQDNQQSKT